MSMFSSTFGQLASALEKEAKGPVAPPPPPAKTAEQAKANKRKGYDKISERAQRRYAEAFAQPCTAPQAGLVFGISGLAVLVQLYRYEKRGFVVRLTEKIPTGRSASAICWQWVGPTFEGTLNDA